MCGACAPQRGPASSRRQRVDNTLLPGSRGTQEQRERRRSDHACPDPRRPGARERRSTSAVESPSARGVLPPAEPRRVALTAGLVLPENDQPITTSPY